MPQAEIFDDRKIRVDSAYRDLELIKMVPGRRWDPKEKYWWLPLSWAACKQLRGVFGDRLEIGPNLFDWAAKELASRVNPAMELRVLGSLPEEHWCSKALDEIEDGAEFKLYPYQRVGAAFLAIAEKAVLADEMGTGKTPMTIRALQLQVWKHGHDAVFPALIVSPNAMKRTWRREIMERWAPELTARVLAPGVDMEKGKLSSVKGVGGSMVKKLADKGITDLEQIDDLTDDDLRQVPGLGAATIKNMRKLRETQRTADAVDLWIVNWESLSSRSRLAGYGSVSLKRCAACAGGEDKATAKSANACQVHPKDFQKIVFKSIVADEAHKAKSPGSQATRAYWAVCHGLSNPDSPDGATFRYPLTGTPIANKVDELWSIMHGVDKDEWPSKSRFVDRYALTSWNAWGGLEIMGVKMETRDEFFSILDPRFLRRPKSAVLKDLPKKVFSKRYVEQSPQERKAYEQMRDDLLAEFGEEGEGGMLLAINPLVNNTRLLQLAQAYGEVDDLGQFHMISPSCKVNALLETVQGELGGEQAIVMAESRQLIELAAEALDEKKISFSKLVGGQGDMEREDEVDRFQAGKKQLILVTLGAGGEGVTLTAASHVLRLQRSWSMVKNLQGEDRAHRIGQLADQVDVIDFITEGTVEEYQLAALAGKHRNLQEVVRDAEVLKALLSGTVLEEAEERVDLENAAMEDALAFAGFA